MHVPGEIPQEIGRAYAQVLIGCLERSVRFFRCQFEVHEAPEKLTFSAFSGKEFSLDALARLSDPSWNCEALVECKGHKDGSKVFDEYKQFVAKAYCVSVAYARHKRDCFVFASNVPFGSSIGRRLVSPDFVHQILIDKENEAVSSLIGAAPVDTRTAEMVSRSLVIAVYPDSMIRLMGISYRVKPQESIWSIMKVLHGGKIPRPYFQPVAETVAKMNDLTNPDKIKAGQRLHLPWYGLQWE